METETRKPLTMKQRKIFLLYQKNMKLVGPTVRELAVMLKQSPANVQQHLRAIRRKGWLNGAV